MKHDQFDPLSSTWFYVKQTLNERLDNYRSQLEGEDIDHDRANVVRGHISEIKLILEIAKPKPDIGVGINQTDNGNKTW